MQKNAQVISLFIGVSLILGLAGYGIFYRQNSGIDKADSNSPTPVKVKIANLPVIQGLPLYLAIEKGYFKDAGIEVEMVKFEAPNQIIDALLQGQVDLTSPSGAMGITGVADFKNPGKLKIYAAGGGTNVIQNDAILVKNDSPIKSIQDLKGKKLGIIAGSIQWRTIARDVLAKNNLVANKDVLLVEVAIGLQAQALGSGQIDAVLGIEPIPTVVKSKGIGREIANHVTTTFIADPFYAGAGIISTDFLKQNPDTAHRVLEIMGRAINEVNQNPDEARPYLKGNTPLDDALIGQVPIANFKFYKDFSQKDIDALQKFYDIFTKHEVVNGKIDARKIIYSPNE